MEKDAYIGARESDRKWTKLSFRGTLRADDTDPKKPWIFLKIHRGLPQAALHSLRAEGVECVSILDKPHITVSLWDETRELIKKHKGAWKGVAKDGKPFQFHLVRIVSLVPHGWTHKYDRVWFIECDSPELEEYRRSMGWEPLPQNSDDHIQRFHITFAGHPVAEKKAEELLSRAGEGFDVLERMFLKTAEEAKPPSPGDALKGVFEKMEFDPDVTEATLGKRFDHGGVPFLLRASNKLLNISRGEEDIDDRDSLAYQTVLGPEDLFAERVSRDAGQIGRRLLWKSTLKGHLRHVPSGALTPQVNSAMTASGLGQVVEAINPVELYDQAFKLNRLGQGGIPSVDSIPADSRNVQPSHLGFVDVIKAPESEKIGVDMRAALGALRGSDGQFYSEMLDLRTGQMRPVSALEASKSIIAFPNEKPDPETGHIRAMIRGRQIEHVKPEEAHFQLTHGSRMFTPASNLVPGMSGVKPGRLIMGSRMSGQALPLKEPEAPLVQSEHEDGRSFEQILGEKAGAVKAERGGLVAKVSNDHVIVKQDDGKLRRYDLHVHTPRNRKTALHNTPMVEVGQVVPPGGLLAKSNYTDDKGHLAIGTNLRVGYMAARGYNFEDAYELSESAAKKLSSDHLYQHVLPMEDNTDIGRKGFISSFPGIYNRAQMANMSEDGVIRPGTKVNKGDPLVLAVNKTQHDLASKLGTRPDFTDASLTWDHPFEGVVTDVGKARDGSWNVAVQSYVPLVQGDKLCYSADTEVLTRAGWKNVAAVTLEDQIATLSPNQELEYLHPAAVHAYPHCGRMYSLETTQVSLLVTEDHALYAKPRNGESAGTFGLHPARDLYGKRYQLKKNAGWSGKDPEFFEFPEMRVKAGQFGRGFRVLPAIKMPIRDYAALLGMYLSEGSSFATKGPVNPDSGGTSGLSIAQRKPVGRNLLFAELARMGLRYSQTPDGAVIRGKQLVEHFKQFGHARFKFIPEYAFDWTAETLQVLYRWLMWGDGCEGGSSHSYTSTSRRLCDDVQRLLLHIGMSGKVERAARERVMTIKGKEYVCRESFKTFVYRHKNEPEIGHGHKKRQTGQAEKWVDYCGQVHCVTLPKNHVLYVRRNGKTVWSGNSGRYGDKGVIARVVPDHLMPHDAEGKPLEILMNPQGVITRGNPAQIYEAMLGKIARKTGQPYKIPAFLPQGKWPEMVKAELAKHGMKDTEDLHDPVSGRTIPEVMTGERFVMKLHHTSEAKLGDRDIEDYSSEGTPGVGSKRVSQLQTMALLAHGATAVLRDAHAVRGQRNDDWWREFRLGRTPPPAQVPFVYKKMFGYLEGAGLRVKRDPTGFSLFAMTDKDIGERSRGEVTNPATVESDTLREIGGGLFDKGLTGGHGGDHFSHIGLPVPLPNPAFEPVMMKILGLTENKFRDVIAGKETINGKTGPEALKEALSRINLDTEIKGLEETVRTGAKTRRDKAVRSLPYLRAMKKNGFEPSDLMLTKALVVPPSMRPINKFRGMQLTADPNFLYKDLMESAKDYKELSAAVGHQNAGEERLKLYDAFKAVAGTGEPVNPKTAEKKVKGLLTHVFGANGPKTGLLQDRVLDASVDLAGRGTIIPNPELSPDQIGIPEEMAKTIFRPFVMRKLVRSGMKAADAAKAVVDYPEPAMHALREVIKERPVLVNRAPTLHKYGFMAHWPVLVKGTNIHVPPVAVIGYGADFDGDAMSVHVPVTDEAVKDAVDKMLPSRNLRSVRGFAAYLLPKNEFQMGLYLAATADNKNAPRVFASAKEVLAAHKRGELDAGDRVEIVGKK